MIGVGWSLFRWAAFCRLIKNKYVEMKSDFAEKKNVQPNTISNKDPELWEYLRPVFGYKYSVEEIVPSIEKRKDTIGVWIVYWPWHVLSYMYYLLLEDVVDFIQHVFKRLYKKITSFIFRDFIAS